MKFCLIPGAPVAAVTQPIVILFLVELETRHLAFSYQVSLFSGLEGREQNAGRREILFVKAQPLARHWLGTSCIETLVLIYLIFILITILF